jgi:serine/threonine protein phosphatase 1
MNLTFPLVRAPRILRLMLNNLGKDYAIGDVHGAFTTLLAAMKEANFDGSRDRIISVGDLIDRGVDSWRCVKFLGLPYTHAVIGNHEDMLFELYENGVPDEAVVQYMARHNGFGWWLDMSDEMRADILTAICTMPTVIELDTPRGLVGFVHGDIPAGMDWPTFVREVEAENADVLQVALWGRDRIEGGNHDGVAGVGRVFVGHTPQWNGVQRFGNVYAIDTGAIFGEMGYKEEGRLTFAEAICRTQILTEPRPPRLVDVRVDDHWAEAANITPFGVYAAN